MLHIREQGQVRASTHISGPTTVDASGGQGPQPPRATTSCSLLLEQEVKDARTSATSAGARSVRTRCVRTGVKPPARGIDGSVHRHFHHDGRPHQDDIEEFRTAPPLRERPSLPRMGPVGQRQLAHHASRRPAGQDRAPSDAPQLPGGGRTGPAAGCAERTGGRTPRPRSPPWSPGPGTCASPLPWRLGPLPVPCRQVAIPCVLGLLGRAGWPTAGTVSADSSDAPRTTGSCRTGRSEQCGAALFHTQLTDVILPVLNNPHASTGYRPQGGGPQSVTSTALRVEPTQHPHQTPHSGRRSEHRTPTSAPFLAGPETPKASARARATAKTAAASTTAVTRAKTISTVIASFSHRDSRPISMLQVSHHGQAITPGPSNTWLSLVEAY